MDSSSLAKDYKDLAAEEKDLIMFTISDLRLEKRTEQVHMVISLKRKIQMELLTTYLPTLLLLIITYATTFFKAIYFEASLTVNLTIMLVMTTIFTSKIQELPPTSDTKMIDIWLMFCLLVPFAFTLVQTAIECYRGEEKEKWAEARKDEQVIIGKPVVRPSLNFLLECVPYLDNCFTRQKISTMATLVLLACQKQKWWWTKVEMVE